VGKPYWVVVGTALIVCTHGVAAPPTAPAASPTSAAPFHYPAARTGDVVDDYHGTPVADPYRWLEDPTSPGYQEWIDAENRITFDFLATASGREAIRARLTQLWNYERFGVPQKAGRRYFFTRNTGLQNQSVWLVAEPLDAEPRILLDPNTLSADGTVALSAVSFTDDGSLMAYGLARAGSDWNEWHIRDVRTGKDLSDFLQWVKFSDAAWTLDGKGFFYSRYEAPKPGAELQAQNYNQKLYYHRVGTPQATDTLVYERPEQKEWQFAPVVTEDGRYLVISVSRDTGKKNLVFYRDLRQKGAPVVELIKDFEADFSFIGNDGPVFWFRSDVDGAARGKVIAIDIRHPSRAGWRTLIAETRNRLDQATVVGDRFILQYLEDAHALVRLHHLDGRFVRELALPGIGSVGGFDGKRKDHETFYYFTSFSVPTSIYRLDVDKAESTLFRAPKVDFDANAYETRQVFYTSKDGTRVPMFLSFKKGMKQDGNNPTLLYGYGGFDAALTPFFSPQTIAWLEKGGIYALANLRGGGEYGEAWHQAGTKLQKQNVFDDFIAAAEYLVAERYTSRSRLAIQGGSNGGLLVGALITQRPDLFAAALPAVGVMDMLRFQKFTIGWAWVSDFGSSDDPEQFKALLAYSPLHNVKPGTRYPAVLATTADHDDRVVPAHSFKFIAALQAAQAGPAPVLIRIETKAGHGAGKPTDKRIQEAADQFAFLFKILGMDASPAPSAAPARSPSAP